MSISKNTLSYLLQLKQHNNKVWFDDNRSSYVEAKTDIINFVDGLLPQLRKFDEQLEPELSADKCVFRIFRDVRFSANKTPYKSNMGAAINPGGKKAAVPGYYVHIEPGNSFVAGGSYLPQAADLAKYRQEIDYNFDEFNAILQNKTFKKFFGNLDPEHKLARPPKGYTADNPAIDYLKLKSFIAFRNFTDKEVTSPDFDKQVVATCNAMFPLMHFLRRSLD
jgi:uncharacterized protein (TIGR02453 family)